MSATLPLVPSTPTKDPFVKQPASSAPSGGPARTATVEPLARPPGRLDGLSPVLTRGTTADHAAVQQFLMGLAQGPTSEIFSQGLENPYYAPGDRLLIKCGGQLVAHVHARRREVQFCGQAVPAAVVDDLVTTPEMRDRGFGRALLAAVDEILRHEGTWFARLRTRIPHFFRACGWVLCGWHQHSRASTRDLLTQLTPPRDAVGGRGPLYLRPWRHVELAGLMRCYEQWSQRVEGACRRSEAYWRWLISRKPFDHIYVATTNGPDGDDDGASMLGYAIVAEDRVLEVVYPHDQPHVGRQLLGRACHEAIERDLHDLQLHAPAGDPLHELFTAAGGRRHWHEVHQGEVFMARLPDLTETLKRMLPVLHRRAVESGVVSRPFELGLVVEGRKHCLVLSRRGVRLLPHRVGRSYLSCSEAEFTRLLLGHYDLAEAVSRGRVEVSTRLAVEVGQHLFPQVALWWPSLDCTSR